MKKATIGILGFLFFVLMISFWNLNSYQSSLADTATSSASEATQNVIENVVSERDQLMKKYFDSFVQLNVEDILMDEMANPDTASFEHSSDTLKVNRTIFKDSGYTTFTGADGVEKRLAFEVWVLFSENNYLPLYVKIGENEFKDIRNQVNSLGLVTKYGVGSFGKVAGNSALDEPLKMIGDPYDMKITLSKYNQIEIGMTYDQITEIIGSFGTEQARSDIAGYQTIIFSWDGVVSIGANANFTLQNGALFSKAQLGLQ